MNWHWVTGDCSLRTFFKYFVVFPARTYLLYLYLGVSCRTCTRDCSVIKLAGDRNSFVSGIFSTNSYLPFLLLYHYHFCIKKKSYLSVFQSSGLKVELCHIRMCIRPTDSFASSAWSLFASLNFFLSRGQMSHGVWLCDHQNIWKSTDFLYDIWD